MIFFQSHLSNMQQTVIFLRSPHIKAKHDILNPHKYEGRVSGVDIFNRHHLIFPNVTREGFSY